MTRHNVTIYRFFQITIVHFVALLTELMVIYTYAITAITKLQKQKHKLTN